MRVVATLLLLFLVALAARAARGDAPEDELALWDALMERGEALYDAGDLAQADAVFTRAAEQARARGYDPRCERYALTYRIQCLQDLLDVPTIRDVSLRLLEVQRGIHDGVSGPGGEEEATETALDVADTLMDVGYVLTVLGDLRGAVRHLHEAIEISRDRRSDARLAAALARLGSTEVVWGRLGPAQAAAEAAEELLARLSEEEDEDLRGTRAANWMVLGKIHLNRQDLERSRACCRRAAALLEGWGEAQPVMQVHLLRLNGQLDLDQGAGERSLEVLGRSRDLELAAHDVIGAAFTEVDAARVELRLGRPDDALARLGGDTVQKAAGDLVASTAAVERGRALQRIGKPAAALRELERAVELSQRIGSHRCESTAWEALAETRLAQGEGRLAADAVRRALDLVDGMSARLTPLAERESRQAWESLFRLAVSIGLGLEDADATYELLERTRASALLQQLGGPDGLFEHAPQAVQGRIQGARDRLVRARDALAAATAANDFKVLVEAGRAYDAAQSAYAEAVERARRSSLIPVAAIRAADPEQPAAGAPPAVRRRDLASLRRTLGETEAFAAYALTADALYALVVTGDRAEVRELGPVSTLDAEIAKLREGIARLPAGHASASLAAFPDPSGLRRLLVDALKLPSTTTRLVVSPDHGLASLPFSLLTDLEREVVVVPSGAVYETLAGRSGERGHGVLALGDPDYAPFPEDRLGSQFAALRSPRGHAALAPLEHTRGEVKAITRAGDVPLLGGDASEEKLLEQLGTRHWRALHLACHGQLDSAHPEWSALALVPSSGADGFLTVLEVLGMDVHADAVVLSACETGLGTELSGDGLLSLSTAFLGAGASRVVASLWPVDDEATSVLMKRFYELWNPEEGAGVGAASALRQAQLHVRTTANGRWAHPFYWAGWVLWGLPD